MCTQHWNLRVSFSCPNCGAEHSELQTHLMGDFGSCVNYYTLGEPVEELKGVSTVLDGQNDDFIGQCTACKAFIEFGAEIVAGAVHTVWPLRWKPKAPPVLVPQA